MSGFDAIYVSIGNSDDKLTQERWAEFWRATDDLLRRNADQVYGVWMSITAAPFQNACWAIRPKYGTGDGAITDGLRALAARFDQESIALAFANTEFVKPAFAQSVAENVKP